MRISPLEPSIVLFRCVPGFETELLAAVQENLGHPSRALVTLGEFDVAAFLFANERPRLEWGSLPHVVGVREARCMMSEEQAGGFLRRGAACLSSFPLISACFIRARTLPLERATQFENQIAEELESACGEDSLVLRTFGHPGLVVVTASDSSVRGLHLLQSILELNSAEHVEKTFSITGIDLDTYSDVREEPNARLSTRISVACSPYVIPSLQRVLSSAISEAVDKTVPDGATSICAGSHDFEIVAPSFEPRYLPRLIRTILAFRRENSERITGTGTTISPYSSEVRVNLRIARDLSPRDPVESLSRLSSLLDISPQEASECCSLVRDFGPLAVRATYAFQDVLRNRLLASDVVDMFRAALKVHEWVNEIRFAMRDRHVAPDSSAMEPLKHALQLLRSLVDGIRLGLHQRTSASYLGAGAQENEVSALVGGQQRLLQAAEAVGWSVWKQQMAAWCRTTAWDGFVVFSPIEEYTANGSILHIPEHRRFDPQYWTTLVHEIAHGLCDVEPCHAVESGVAALRTRGEGGDAGAAVAIGEERYDPFVTECIADIVQVVFGPFWEPDLIVIGFWDPFGIDFLDEYARPEWRASRSELCCRGFLIYLACQHLLKRVDQNSVSGWLSLPPPPGFCSSCFVFAAAISLSKGKPNSPFAQGRCRNTGLIQSEGVFVST